MHMNYQGWLKAVTIYDGVRDYTAVRDYIMSHNE